MKVENGMVNLDDIAKALHVKLREREFKIRDEETWNSLIETERDRLATKAMLDIGVIVTSW